MSLSSHSQQVPLRLHPLCDRSPIPWDLHLQAWLLGKSQRRKLSAEPCVSSKHNTGVRLPPVWCSCTWRCSMAQGGPPLSSCGALLQIHPSPRHTINRRKDDKCCPSDQIFIFLFFVCVCACVRACVSDFHSNIMVMVLKSNKFSIWTSDDKNNHKKQTKTKFY